MLMSATVSEGFHTDDRLAAAGFAAGFTTKALGSMHLAESRAKALERAGLAAWPAYMHQQVHEKTVLPLSSASSELAKADGWVVDAPGRVALVYAADCAPVFIWDKKGRAAALLHSGWRGTFANIAAEGVKALAARGIAPAELEAYVGARAGACCYAVSDDFEAKFDASTLQRRGGKLYFDNGAAIRGQLIAAGVAGSAIALDQECTICSGNFFSYRRSKDGTRMMGMLAMRGAAA
jgi:YfiH family protein